MLKMKAVQHKERFKFIADVEDESMEQKVYQQLIGQLIRSVATACIAELRVIDKREGYPGIKRILETSNRTNGE